MNQTNNCCMSLIALALIAGISNAQVQSSDSSKMADRNSSSLEEVTVQAKKIGRVSKDTLVSVPVYSVLSVAQTSSGVQVITEKEIEKLRPADVYDLFETSLGLSIRRQGSRVHNWVMDRGGSTNCMGLILDGVFISSNEATRILGDLSVSAIESIRIVRDASLMTLGPILSGGSNGGSNQGFIIISTKHGLKTGTEALLSYGNWNTYQAGIFHGQALSDNLSFGIGYTRSGNDHKIDQSGDWFNGYSGNLFWGNISYNSPWLLANVTALFNQVKRDIQRYQEANGTWGTAVWTYDPINTTHIGLDLSVPWNNWNTTQVTFGISGDRGNLYGNTAQPIDYLVDSITKFAAKPFEDRSYTGNLLHTFILGSNTTKIGSQIIQDMQQIEGSTTISLGEVFGFYFSDEYQFNDALIVDIGARLDKQYTIYGSEKYTSDSVTTKIKSHMWTDDAYSGALGALFSPIPVFSLSGRFSLTNTPTPSTMTTVTDLPDELRLKFEVGPTFNILPEFNVGFTGYCYEINDAKVAAVKSTGKAVTLKTKDGTLITVYDAKNLSRNGFEVSVNGNVLKWFGYDFGWTYGHSSYKSEDTTMMRYKLTGKIDFHKDKFGIMLSTVSVPEYTHNNMPVGDFNIFNVNINQQITNNINLSAYGRNITDEKYTTNYKGVGSGYYYDIGAVYGIEVKLNF